MRLSQFFGLSGTQGTFDFIDVYVDKDVALFIDPSAIATINSDWADECTATVQSFFQRVLHEVSAGHKTAALDLLGHLSEENATHLGYSQSSKGSGIGAGLAKKFYDELSSSAAVTTGLISDLEETALLVPGIEEDRISDVTTNILRKQLAEYTVDVANYYGIPLHSGVALNGPEWDLTTTSWKTKTYNLPMGPQGPLLLVPKSIARRKLFLNAGDYYTWHVLEHLKQLEYNNPQSPFMVILKSGTPKVRKTALSDSLKSAAKAATGNKAVIKHINAATTAQAPDILSRYRALQDQRTVRAPTSAEVATATDTAEVDLDNLLAEVLAVPTGKPTATDYERAAEALLSALFYPELLNPIRQFRMHDGRKIIDITFTNAGDPKRFFGWLGAHHPAGHVFVECKNYAGDVKNPEFDQLAGRFSPSRGKYGLLVCRTITDKSKTIQSCRDTAQDQRGFMTPLDDDDLKVLVEESKSQGSVSELGGLLHKRFLGLI